MVLNLQKPVLYSDSSCWYTVLEHQSIHIVFVTYLQEHSSRPLPPSSRAPPAAGYPAYSAHTTTVLIVNAAPISNPPNDYLPLSVFTTLCCCFWIGVFAIVKSLAVRTAVANSKLDECSALTMQLVLLQSQCVSLCNILEATEGVIIYSYM